MKKIEFKNNEQPYLSAENLNQMQDNMEEAIGGIAETGTFTPTVRGGTTTGTITYILQQGIYTKIGNMVFVDFKIGISSVTGADGFIIIEGLPNYHSRKPNQSVIMPVICNGGLFDEGTNYLLWDGEGLIVTTKNQGLGGTKIKDTTTTSYIYATGSYMLNE